MAHLLTNRYEYKDGVLYDKQKKFSKTDIAGTLTAKGRYRVMYNGKLYQRSHLVWAMHHGRMPANGMVIDHIDGNPGNDKIENLREVSQSTNIKNGKFKPHLGINGVRIINKGYGVDIVSEGIKSYRSFACFFEACCWRKSMENKLGGWL